MMSSKPVNLLRAGIIVTMRCTLHCKLCGTFAPYYNPKPHYKKEEICKTIDRFFAAVDYVGDISFSGGEPLLHRDLASFLIRAKTFESQYGRLLVLTNGSILPDQKLLDVMKFCGEKFQVNISNYGSDKSIHCEELKDLLSKNGIKWREIEYYGDELFCDGWVDLRDHTQKYFSHEDIYHHAQKCLKQTGGQCFVIIGGEMHNCARSYRRMYLGIIPRNLKEYVDFWDETQSVAEQREIIRKMVERGYTTSCAYCAGTLPDSPRHTPAEQLPPDFSGREDDLL